jgi:methanogenic corrinoid protein MtbC1
MKPPSPGRASPAHGSSDGLSIGDLAEACGIGEATLRAWERRYGRPKAQRRPSGHRRYGHADVTWLRRVAEALARGGRASDVVTMEPAALDAFLAAGHKAAEANETTTRMLEWVRDYDGAKLRRSLREAWNRMEPLTFLRERLAPLLEAVGRGWADGSLEIRHEHFLSEVVEDLLRTLRDRMGENGTGPLVVLATLPQEHHGICLQMAAIGVVAQGGRVRMLGTSTPVEQIVQAANETQARGVALSVSLASGGVATDRELARLRKALPADVRLAAGGEGMRGPRRAPPGVTRLTALDELCAWIRTLDT